MTLVASRELRNDTRGLLERVASGEEIVITVDGRPAALLLPVGHRPRWVSSVSIVERLRGRQADPGLLVELRTSISPDNTDDL